MYGWSKQWKCGCMSNTSFDHRQKRTVAKLKMRLNAGYAAYFLDFKPMEHGVLSRVIHTLGPKRGDHWPKSIRKNMLKPMPPMPTCPSMQSCTWYSQSSYLYARLSCACDSHDIWVMHDDHSFSIRWSAGVSDTPPVVLWNLCFKFGR